jgi:pimeloyl-ACP methyl ester carboxylesterase
VKRFFVSFAVLLIVLVTVPPTWFALFPITPPELPPAGTKVAVREDANANVIDVGTGQAIVLSHGLPGMASDWRELAPKLVDQGFRVIAYDRLGYGHSDLRPADEYTINANVVDLLGLIDALVLDDVVVAGWSYGGAITMGAAQAGASAISRIVLIGTGGPSSDDDVPPDPSLFTRFLYSNPVSLWRQSVPPLSHSVMAVFSNTAFNGGPQPDWFLDGLKASLARPATALTFRREMFAVDDTVTISPASITQPTLLVHGEEDALAPVAIARYLSTVIPKAKYVEVAGEGHMLPITHPDVLAKAIRSFVDGGTQIPR